MLGKCSSGEPQYAQNHPPCRSDAERGILGFGGTRNQCIWGSTERGFVRSASREAPGAVESAIPVAACPRSLARQDLLKRPLDPIDFFAEHSDSVGFSMGGPT